MSNVEELIEQKNKLRAEITITEKEEVKVVKELASLWKKLGIKAPRSSLDTGGGEAPTKQAKGQIPPVEVPIEQEEGPEGPKGKSEEEHKPPQLGGGSKGEGDGAGGGEQETEVDEGEADEEGEETGEGDGEEGKLIKAVKEAIKKQYGGIGGLKKAAEGGDLNDIAKSISEDVNKQLGE